jgi:hypothetical protein
MTIEVFQAPISAETVGAALEVLEGLAKRSKDPAVPLALRLERADDLALMRFETPLALRLELADDLALMRFETGLHVGFQLQAKRQALVATLFTIPWWQMSGLWPRHPGPGWVILLRRVEIEARPQGMPPPPRGPSLVKAG